MDLNLLLPLVGVMLGWALNELSAHFRNKRQWRSKRRELLLDAYAIWCAEMEIHLVDYARGAPAEKPKPDVSYQRLMLLETDYEARRCVESVRNSLPAFGSTQYQELELMAHTEPEWEWSPFRRSMNALHEHIRLYTGS